MRLILIAFAICLSIGFVAKPANARARPARQTDKDAAHSTGDYRKTWKDGPNLYRFEGSSGGCRYSGSVSPSGYHLDRSC